MYMYTMKPLTALSFTSTFTSCSSFKVISIPSASAVVELHAAASLLAVIISRDPCLAGTHYFPQVTYTPSFGGT